MKTHKIPKIRRHQEAEIRIIALITTLFMWLVILIAVILRPTPTTDNTAELINKSTEAIVAEQRILDKLAPLPVFVLIKKEQIASFAPNLFTLPDELKTKRIIPFFYAKTDAEKLKAQIQQLTQDGEPITIEKVQLSLVYQEEVNRPEHEYLLILSENNRWVFYTFDNIPVYSIVNKEKKHPLHVEITVDNQTALSIPYFLNKQEAEKRLNQQKIKQEWEIKKHILKDVLDSIANHVLGPNIVIVPYNLDEINRPTLSP